MIHKVIHLAELWAYSTPWSSAATAFISHLQQVPRQEVRTAIDQSEPFLVTISGSLQGRGRYQ